MKTIFASIQDDGSISFTTGGRIICVVCKSTCGITVHTSYKRGFPLLSRKCVNCGSSQQSNNYTGEILKQYINSSMKEQYQLSNSAKLTKGEGMDKKETEAKGKKGSAFIFIKRRAVKKFFLTKGKKITRSFAISVDGMVERLLEKIPLPTSKKVDGQVWLSGESEVKFTEVAKEKEVGEKKTTKKATPKKAPSKIEKSLKKTVIPALNKLGAGKPQKTKVIPPIATA